SLLFCGYRIILNIPRMVYYLTSFFKYKILSIVKNISYEKGEKMKNITVVGMGYVGLANATLLSQHNNVIALEVIEERVKDMNRRVSPIQDAEVERYFETKDLHLKATT